jgi:hypothetical protein
MKIILSLSQKTEGRLSAGETLGREPVCFHSFDISLASGPQ